MALQSLEIKYQFKNVHYGKSEKIATAVAGRYVLYTGVKEVGKVFTSENYDYSLQYYWQSCDKSSIIS